MTNSRVEYELEKIKRFFSKNKARQMDLHEL